MVPGGYVMVLGRIFLLQVLSPQGGIALTCEADGGEILNRLKHLLHFFVFVFFLFLMFPTDEPKHSLCCPFS